MSQTGASTHDHWFIFAAVLFVAAFQLYRWYRKRRGQTAQASVGFALLLVLSGVFLGYGVYRSAQVSVSPEEQVVVTRFGKPTGSAVQGPSRILIAPFGIDVVHRYPTQLGTVELSCENPPLRFRANLLIEDPVQSYRIGITLERLQGFICFALNREQSADGAELLEVDIQRLNAAIHVAGLKASSFEKF